LKFPVYKQLDAMDCGPTCLRMVAKYYGRLVSLDYLRNKSQYAKNGVSLLGLADAAESIGLKSVGAKLTFEQLVEDAKLPAIIHWNQYHFVVLTPRSTKNKLTIADPAKGLITVDKEQFLKNWLSTNENGSRKGITLLLEPTPEFKELDYGRNENSVNKKIGWGYLFTYVKQHRKYLLQIALGFLIASVLQVVFPYLTQSIVDTGINSRDLSFIQIILAAQLMLLFSQTIVEFIRSRLLLHISARINISLLSSFWSKLLKLPLIFFDSKHPGDIIQRLNDQQRIESFLTGAVLNTLFSILNIIIFSFVLLQYSVTIFGIFTSGSILHVLWIRFFLKYRRRLDYQRFSISSRENNATMQLVYGIQEIKLNNAESTYRWTWESLKASLFKLSFKSLSLDQFQQVGAFLINQGKNILITFVVAKLVIDGSLTMGMMLAIQYIIGQLNSPIEQLIGFTQRAQDAKISLERLNDIHSLDDEEPADKEFKKYLPEKHEIRIKNLSFTYPGAGNEPVLKNINLSIPQGKITAIVGMSGSGKTTLIKLLLRFYETYKGEVFLGDSNLKTVSPKYWRSVCGAVMQDSFIFNANIRKNITVTDDRVNQEQLISACRTANILDFIESLPLGFYTKLGAEGTGVSGGQKQRITIARAVYKNPRIIFFDEATNSLDANNEKVILENLQEFFQGKTVVVVAHRLSTVKKADKIIVLENGEIAEEGNHTELTLKKGKYYNLVKNQLELGN
jgi:ATP-binding cassette subfamily B protein